MSILLSPIHIRGIPFRNRIVMPPMVRAVRLMPPEVVATNGHVTDAVIDHYARRARAGVALVIVEATAIEQGGRVWKDGLNLFTDAHAAELAPLAYAIRSAGAIPGIQLIHGGPQSAPALTGHSIVGPSAVRSSEGVPLPAALSLPQIRAIQNRFADAADRALAAGFQYIELHAAHGYLLDSFLMKRRNHRTDSYGGDIHNRLRMLLETAAAVRKRIANRALLSCRISIFNKLAEGFSPDDLHALVAALNDLDLLHLSTANALAPAFDSPRTMAQWVKSMTDLPLIVAGRLRTPADAHRLLSEHHADLAAIGIALLRDPHWPQHAGA